MFTYQDQKELNKDGVDNLFRELSEFFSTLRVEGKGGLKEKFAAFYRTEDFGRQELDDLASRCLNPKEVTAYLQVHPDADVPNYDRIYMDLVQKLMCQVFLELLERGALEDIKLIDGELPEVAQRQFEILVDRARGTQQKISPVERKAAADEELRDFATKYSNERMDNLRPRGGVVILAGEQVPFSVFKTNMDRAIEAGYIR